MREQVAAEPATTVVNPVTTNPSEEIARLKAKVAQLKAVANHAPRCSVEAVEAVKMRAAKRRSRCVDDSLPNDEQALCEWVDSKMMELWDVTDVGGFGVSGCIDESDRPRCIQDEIGNAATVDCIQHGCFLRLKRGVGTVANGLGRPHNQDPCAVSQESRTCGTCSQGRHGDMW